jgi:hypothetical protein
MKAKTTIAALMLLLAAAGPATKPALHLKADAPLAVQAIYYGKHKDQKKQRLADLAKLIDAARKEESRIRSLSVPKDFDTVDAKKQAVADQQAKIDDLLDAKKTVTTATADEKLLAYNADYNPIAVNSAGIITVVSVFQVIDKQTAILTVQGMTGTNVLASATRQDMWITGLDTSKMTDGAGVGTLQIEITGNKQYDTALGATKTILAGKVFDISDYLEEGAK